MKNIHRLTRRMTLIAAGLALTGTAISAHAEGRIRIAQQFGIVYLMLNVAEEQKLIEKHAKAAGVDAKVEFVRLSGGAAVNDALLAGNIDIAGAGVGPLLTLWDRRASIEAFAGNPIDLARYYDADRDYLLDFRKTVEHFEVAGVWGDASEDVAA